MSSQKGNGSNPPSTSPDSVPEMESNETQSFRRRLRKVQQGGQRVFAPKLLDALRRSQRSSTVTVGSENRRRWRTTSAQKVYSLKLYEALQRSRRSSSTGIKVRDTADKVLAATARGTTRWSRAILVSRIGASQRRQRKTKLATAAEVRRSGGGRRKLSVMGNRVRLLAGLVPGCRRTALPELLEETADYISALEMQVKAMTALSQILAQFQPPSDKLGSAYS